MLPLGAFAHKSFGVAHGRWLCFSKHRFQCLREGIFQTLKMASACGRPGPFEIRPKMHRYTTCSGLQGSQTPDIVSDLIFQICNSSGSQCPLPHQNQHKLEENHANRPQRFARPLRPAQPAPCRPGRPALLAQLGPLPNHPPQWRSRAF